MKILTAILLLVSICGNSQDTVWFNGTNYTTIVAQPGKVYASKTGAVITGFANCTMNNIGGNIWQSQPISKPNVVKINGVTQLPGREPNTGYFYLETGTDTTLTDNQLNGSWLGGELIIRKNNWNTILGTVVKQTGTTLQYTSANKDAGTNGWGYFIQNHPNALDQQNEWCYTNGRLRVYSTNEPMVEASQINQLITGNGATFVNLTFEGGNETVSRQANTFKGCTFKNTGSIALYANGGTLTVDGCTFINTGNIAVLGENATVNVINNSISTVGVEGMPGVPAITNLEYTAIRLTNCSFTVKRNSIYNVGYNGIHIIDGGGTIENNVIKTFNLYKDDGAGIYKYRVNYLPGSPSAKTVIKNNLVLSGIGASAARNNPWYMPVYGIYMDDYSNNNDIIANTVANCAGSGIYIHNSYNNLIRDNTCFNNGNSTADPASVAQIQFLNDGGTISGITLKNNYFVSRTTNQLCYKWDVGSYRPTADSNVYARPINDFNTVRVCDASCVLYNGFSFYEPNVSRSPRSVSSVDSIKFEYSEATPRTIQLPGVWVNMRNTGFTQFTLQPYSSMVLVYKNGGVLSLNDTTDPLNRRNRFDGYYKDRGNYLKILKPGILNIYRIDGALLLSKRVVAGEVVMKQNVTDKANFIPF